MRYFPVFLDLDGQPVLVVGGGAVAERKIRLLLKAGARVAVVAPACNAAIRRWTVQGKVEHLGTEYAPEHLDRARLVFAATDDPAVNRKVYADAELRAIPVNAVDDRAHCRFISPAIVDRSPVLVAVSTGGTSPVLARRIRALVESVLPIGLGRVAAAAGRLRAVAARRLPTAIRRQRWEACLSSRNLARWPALPPARVEREMRRALLADGPEHPSGQVFVVGAGPGRADLLTVRAKELLGQADVIVHDRLVPEEILELARRDADRIDVGKRAGAHRCAQRDIHRILVDEARRGRTVVRLKGGDPFVFGRGGEELQALREAGIAYEVVPGVTAAIGCAAYAGIPLTHREHAQALTFLTGHRAPDGADAENRIDWSAIVGPGKTAVVYMGVAQAGRIREDVLQCGVDANLPVAVVADGTRDSQAVFHGTIGELPALAARVGPDRPGLLVIGQVAALGSNLCWFQPGAAIAAAA